MIAYSTNMCAGYSADMCTGYSTDMCTGYVQPYDGDGWSWTGQAWGAGYDQLPYEQYDCGGWDYTAQQQGWGGGGGGGGQEEQPQEEPKAGAELLTDFKLAELKRLIDRDAEEEAQRQAGERRQSPEEEAGRQPKEKRELPKEEEDTREDVQDVETTEASGSCTATAVSPPGLDAPMEQRYRVLADFEPESRRYGEMPVRIGEEVFVREEPLDGWIFGSKKGSHPDEGWLPASALGLGAREGEEEESGAEAEAEARRRLAAQRQQRGRGGHASAAADGLGRRQRQPKQQPQQQQPQQQASGAGPKARKAGGSSTRAESSSAGGGAAAGAGASGGAGPERQQTWHQHGQWWSCQRHLKTAEGKAPEAGSGGGWQSRDGPAGAASLGRGAGGGRGGSGRGGGREPRPRPALSSLLSRLNKPLEPPKPQGRS